MDRGSLRYILAYCPEPGPALLREGIACGREGVATSNRRRKSSLKTLFLSPPSFDGFDGGAGARYQAKREVTSFWYPTWLAQPAALVPGSTLVDAAPHGQTIEDVLTIAKDHDLVIMHTSTPSLPNDVECARRLKAQDPNVKGRLHRRARRRAAGADAA